MREILFRAKRLKDGQWVEGLLWKKKYKSNKLFISYFPDEDDHEEVYVVDPETVCQYTGLTDKNGVKIFEWDIVDEFDMCKRHRGKGVVHMDDTFIGWYISEGKCLFRPFTYEVIGNIFDNPELVKGGAE